MAFNPITLNYENSEAGSALKKRDEMSKERAFVRSRNIDRCLNSQFNILTGETRQFKKLVAVPDKFK